MRRGRRLIEGTRSDCKRYTGGLQKLRAARRGRSEEQLKGSARRGELSGGVKFFFTHVLPFPIPTSHLERVASEYQSSVNRVPEVDTGGRARTGTPLRAADFHTTIAFATCCTTQFVVWTMPSPCAASKATFRREPSRLYTLLAFVLTLRANLSSALPSA